MDRDLLIGYRIPLGCHEDVLEWGSSVGAAFYAKGYESRPFKMTSMLNFTYITFVTGINP